MPTLIENNLNSIKKITQEDAAKSVLSDNEMAKKQLQKQKMDFLNLLTAQIRYQDPLNPMESKDATQQYIGFSTVEQQIKSNETLSSINKSLAGSQLDQATSYIGKEVISDSSSIDYTQGIHTSIPYTLSESALKSEIIIYNQKNDKIKTIQGATQGGDFDVVWDGTDDKDKPVAGGYYKIRINAVGDNNRPIAASTQRKSDIVSSKIENGKTYLIASTGLKIPIEHVQQVNNSRKLNPEYYVGKTVQYALSKIKLPDQKDFPQSFNLQETLSPEAAQGYIKIIGSNGRIVKHIPHEMNKGINEFSWDGKDKLGQSQERGSYSIEVVDSENRPIQAFNFGKIIGMDMQNKNNQLLRTETGKLIKTSDILTIINDK